MKNLKNIKTMTEQELSDLYDTQIEALLDDNYKRFCDLIDYNGDSGAWNSHEDAWACTANYPLSLFASLPECAVCASQIEYLEFLQRKKEDSHWSIPIDGFTGKEEEYATIVLENKNCVLPNLNGSDEDSNYNFSSEELEEFKRRQMVAHFPPLDK